MGINKVDAFGRTLIDVSNDTVTPESLDAGVTAHNAAGERIVGTRIQTVDFWNYSAQGHHWLRLGEMNFNGKCSVLFDISTDYSYFQPMHIIFIFSQEWNSGDSIITRVKMLLNYGYKFLFNGFRFVRDKANDFSSKTYFDMEYAVAGNYPTTVNITATNLGIKYKNNGDYIHFRKPDEIIIDPEILDTQNINEYPRTEWDNLA